MPTTRLSAVLCSMLVAGFAAIEMNVADWREELQHENPVGPVNDT